jgi:xanthine/CO dehydrogenase XdhC/CoxF family maturation factor
MLRSKIFAPAGLDLGAEEPGEIALAIVAEIQATFGEAAGASLRDRKTSIHVAPEFPAALVR